MDRPGKRNRIGLAGRALAVSLCAGLLSMAGCGGGSRRESASVPEVEEVVSQVVTSTGGTIAITEEMSPTLAGLELDIPPGALLADERIAVGEVVSEIPSHSEGCLSLGYQFSLQPSGLSFETPVTLRVVLPDAEWRAWSSLLAPEDVALMKYDEGSHVWGTVPIQARSEGVLTATLHGFSLLDVVFFWKPSNPASDEKILKQALAWAAPGMTRELVRSRLSGHLFLDDSASTISTSEVTFAERIGALLLAESMWDRISDGNFYAAASYAETVLTTLPRAVLESFAKKVAGLPSLGIAATAAALVIDTAVKHFLDAMTTAAFNNQLRAYLSWRGWFFERGTWTYEESLASDHDTALSDQPFPHLNELGWFNYRQVSDGTYRSFGYLPAKPPGGDPADLFMLGSELCRLLDAVVLRRDWVWYAGSDLNGLEADRAWLERAFGGLNQAPEVAIADAERTASLGNTITLQGSASDPEGDHMVSRWDQTGGPEVQLDYLGNLEASFTPTEPGTYRLRLDVWDTLVENHRKVVTTIVVPGQQIADQSPAVEILHPPNGAVFSSGATVEFEGQAIDPEEGELTGEHLIWTEAEVFGQGDAQARVLGHGRVVSVSDLPDGTHYIYLVAVDSRENVAADAVTIVMNEPVPNRPAIADAGEDTSGTPGETIVLDGTGSHDPDGEQIWYTWIQVDGPPVELQNGGTPSPSFVVPGYGTYVFRLAVVDTNGGSSSDDVEVTVPEPLPEPSPVPTPPVVPTSDPVGTYLNPLISEDILEIDAGGKCYLEALGLNLGSTGTWAVNEGRITLFLPDGALRGTLMDGAIVLDSFGILPTVWIEESKPPPSPAEVAGTYLKKGTQDEFITLRADGTYDSAERGFLSTPVEASGEWHLEGYALYRCPMGDCSLKVRSIILGDVIHQPDIFGEVTWVRSGS